MRVRLLKSIGGHKAGDEIDPLDSVAADLINKQVAEEVKRQSKPRKSRPAADDSEPPSPSISDDEAPAG